MIDENAGELFADRLLEQNRADRAVDAAGHGEKNFFVADLPADFFNLVFDVFLRVEGLSDLRQPFFFSFVHFCRILSIRKFRILYHNLGRNRLAECATAVQ